jgi:hypothetical protein
MAHAGFTKSFIPADWGNQGVRRRQLHDILRHPGYDSMLAARGEGLPDDL